MKTKKKLVSSILILVLIALIILSVQIVKNKNTDSSKTISDIANKAYNSMTRIIGLTIDEELIEPPATSEEAQTEAQTDRFLFKLKMYYPEEEEEIKIIDQNITVHTFEEFNLKRILSPEKIIKLQKLTKEINASSPIKKYIVKIVDATRNPKNYNLRYGKYIEWGASPRASIALQIAAKADAVLKGQKAVTPQNIKNISKEVLRHRIILNYAGQAENIDTDKIIEEILSKVKVP